MNEIKALVIVLHVFVFGFAAWVAASLILETRQDKKPHDRPKQ